MKTEYSRIDYDADRLLIERCHSAEHSDVMGKLEALVDSPVDQRLFIGHAGARVQFLSMESALHAIENPAYLAGIILRRRKDLSGNGLKTFADEILSTVHKHVEEVFGQRYRGAVKRVQRYEKEMFSDELKDLRSAIRSKNPDRIYDVAERICIMAENFPDTHPVSEAYAELKPKISEIINNAPVSND